MILALNETEKMYLRIVPAGLELLASSFLAENFEPHTAGI